MGGDTNNDTGYVEPTTSHKDGQISKTGGMTGTSDMDVSANAQTTNHEHSRKAQSNDYQASNAQVQASTGGQKPVDSQ